MALSRKSREKLNEWLTWYNWHHDKITSQPLETQVAWLMKAQQGAYEALSLIARELNGEMKPGSTAGGLILPGSRW